MGQYKLDGHPPVPLTLRRSPRARRISLRISQLDGRVTLTLPKNVPEQEALDFAQSKNEWIRSHLQDRTPLQKVDHGVEIPVEGKLLQIVPAVGRRIEIGENRIAVPEGSTGKRVQRFLKELARERLVEASDHYADILGRSYSRITLRDTRSRWGSCTSEGALMFSWRLILAPAEVLKYVAAHEVAHLEEMNHSSDFWSQVHRLYGPHDVQRRWLSENGAELHRYRFD